MDIYPFQQEIIDALHSGKNVVRFGSRRVGLTTSALIFIEERLQRGQFNAAIYTRNTRIMIPMLESHDLPIVDVCHSNGKHATIRVGSVSDCRALSDFDLYDDTNLPRKPLINQWALLSTHGMCGSPSNYLEPFEHMEYVAWHSLY